MIVQAFKEKAEELGFIAVGFSKPQTPLFFDFYVQWLEQTDVGDMTYLTRNIPVRRDPAQLLNGVRTVISLAYPYSASKPCSTDGFASSRYSTPKEEDYHLRLRKLAQGLCTFIREMVPESRSRVCVDSAPILERSFALMSGVGFIGKNNMLIIPGHGSYCFLVEILTTAAFHIPSVKRLDNRCGSCTECIDQCPTGALKAPFSIDVSRCLSYLTIESKGHLEGTLSEKMGNTFFGCDVCQEVCPLNKRVAPTVSLPSTDTILAMSELEFKKTFEKTAFERTGLSRLKRNIALVRDFKDRF